MKKINFGPVVDENGEPTEFTKQMLAGTGRLEEVVARARGTTMSKTDKAYAELMDFAQNDLEKARRIASFIEASMLHESWETRDYADAIFYGEFTKITNAEELREWVESTIDIMEEEMTDIINSYYN